MAETEIMTLTPIEILPFIGLDGTPALVLKTKEAPPLAIPLNAETTAAIRDVLDKLQVAFTPAVGRG